VWIFYGGCHAGLCGEGVVLYLNIMFSLLKDLTNSEDK
jgi:hypothetical protein